MECEDILADRRTGSDLRWALRDWDETVIYKYRKKLNKQKLFHEVLKSERVNSAVIKLMKDGQSRKSSESKVTLILEDMCHTLETGMIRKFAVTLPKIMKKIYGQVLVNKTGIEEIKNITEETPVVFLPTHRSYADFLLISYIAFHYNLPFPVIAAGMDFMSMVAIGDMLRGAGAFYIKRSFMDDCLYWAVFQEYVQRLICDSGQPLEFFLEGTRSRSGKSLPPKLGLLGCVAECWLRGKLPDIKIVPISISYNRTLEENLYAYEMLGVPKPKESTSGLFKAMKILKEDFGNIYVHIGQSVSVSEYLSGKVDRHLNVDPLYFSSLSVSEFNACEELALGVTRSLQMNCVVSIWSVACVSLLRCLWGGLWSLPFHLLYKETLVVALLAKRMGAVVEGSDSSESIETHLRRSFRVHCETAVLSADDIVSIQVIHKHNQRTRKADVKGFSFDPSTIESSVTHLMLQYYLNQVLHLFIRPILVVMATRSCSKSTSLSSEQAFEKYSLLNSIFSFDFIFEKQLRRQDFEAALLLLKEEESFESPLGVHLSGEGKDSRPLDSLLLHLIRPFVLNYQVALHVAETQASWDGESSIVTSIQKCLETHASIHLLYSSLSIDTSRNAVKMMLKLDAISKNNSPSGKTEFIPNPRKIFLLKKALEPSLLVSKEPKPKL